LAQQVARRQMLERVFEAAYLDRDLYGRDDAVVLRWPEALGETASLTARLQTPSESIFMEAWPVAQAGAAVSVAKGFHVLDGPYRILLMPRPEGTTSGMSAYGVRFRSGYTGTPTRKRPTAPTSSAAVRRWKTRPNARAASSARSPKWNWSAG